MTAFAALVDLGGDKHLRCAVIALNVQLPWFNCRA